MLRAKVDGEMSQSHVLSCLRFGGDVVGCSRSRREGTEEERRGRGQLWTAVVVGLAPVRLLERGRPPSPSRSIALKSWSIDG